METELRVNMGYIEPKPYYQPRLFEGHLGWNNNHIDLIKAANKIALRGAYELHNLGKESAHEDKCTPDDFIGAPTGYNYDK